MSLYRDEGVVLRTQKLGEADRIVTLLTRRHGRVRAVAKGVRRTRSKFGARLEPFSHVDVQCYLGRSLDVVTQAESIAAYGAAIAADYPRYTAGTAMLETAERFTDAEREPAVQQYLLLVGGLRALAEQEHDAGLVLDAFLVRSLAVAGYAPSFDACARCGLPGPHRFFHVAGGGAICGDCKPAGAAAPAEHTVRLLAALLSGDWPAADGPAARPGRARPGRAAHRPRDALATGHSRLPAFGGGDVDEVVGVLHVVDLFGLPYQQRARTRVSEIMRPVTEVPESLPLDDTLETLRAAGTRLAAVVDEYGGFAGLLTAEDLLEELVGEIRDDNDPAHGEPHHETDGSVLVPGRWRRHEFERELGVELPEGPYETVAGLVVHRLERLAEVHDEVVLASPDLRFRVEAVERRAITKVRVSGSALSPPGTEHRNGGGG